MPSGNLMIRRSLLTRLRNVGNPTAKSAAHSQALRVQTAELSILLNWGAFRRVRAEGARGEILDVSFAERGFLLEAVEGDNDLVVQIFLALASVEVAGAVVHGYAL